MYNGRIGTTCVSEAPLSPKPVSDAQESPPFCPFGSRALESILLLILAINCEREQSRMQASTLVHPNQSYVLPPSISLLSPFLSPSSIPLHFSPHLFQLCDVKYDTARSNSSQRSSVPPSTASSPSSSLLPPPTTDNQPGSRKKLVWTEDLHNRFVAAVLRLGIKSATPARILREMSVANLTRAHVSSHLQKYRAAVRSQYRLASFKQLRDHHLPRDLTPEQQQLAVGQNKQSPKAYTRWP